MGQNLKAGLEIAVPHLGQGGAAGAAGATATSPSLAPQKAQKGIVLSIAWPHFEHCMSPAPSGDVAYTRVAVTPTAPRAVGIETADAVSGLPQSMQNREPSSLRRPQWAQSVTSWQTSASSHWTAG
jgi:hypothetical protein